MVELYKCFDACSAVRGIVKSRARGVAVLDVYRKENGKWEVVLEGEENKHPMYKFPSSRGKQRKAHAASTEPKVPVSVISQQLPLPLPVAVSEPVTAQETVEVEQVRTRRLANIEELIKRGKDAEKLIKEMEEVRQRCIEQAVRQLREGKVEQQDMVYLADMLEKVLKGTGV